MDISSKIIFSNDFIYRYHIDWINKYYYTHQIAKQAARRPVITGSKYFARPKTINFPKSRIKSSFKIRNLLSTFKAMYVTCLLTVITSIIKRKATGLSYLFIVMIMILRTAKNWVITSVIIVATILVCPGQKQYL